MLEKPNALNFNNLVGIILPFIIPVPTLGLRHSSVPQVLILDTPSLDSQNSSPGRKTFKNSSQGMQ
jgi:hypothetical protein